METHRDHVGNEYDFRYKALPSADHQAVMLARVPRIEAALAEAEFPEALDSDGWKPLVHQTPAQFAARLRARYKESSQIECARIAKWILDHIDAGHFTDAQVRNAFGLTVTQWNALKAKMSRPTTVPGSAGRRSYGGEVFRLCLGADGNPRSYPF